MNIDNLTIGEARRLAAMFGCMDGNGNQPHPAIGKKCIVRTYGSGVHFGEVLSVGDNGGNSRCVLKNGRRLWRWQTKTGVSLSDLAQGIDLGNSKICAVVPEHYIEDAIEFIPATPKVCEDIEGAEAYRA